MRFTKIQGCGNDFVILDGLSEPLPEARLPLMARRLCERRFSLGADGLMAVLPPQGEGCLRMRFFNADGSEGEMCGNGARCMVRYALDRGYASGEAVIETISGPVRGWISPDGLCTVRLRDPSAVELHRTVAVEEHTFDCDYVELGRPGLPHAVVLWEGWEDVPEDALRRFGRALRHHSGFPKGTNVTFCRLTGKDRVKAVTFERGVEDFTAACGTGCGALTTALTLRGLTSGKDVRILMPGGELRVSLTLRDGAITDLLLTAPAVTVAEGTLFDIE